MAVTAEDLREYLRLPQDQITVMGDATVDHAAFIEAVKKGGVYTFIKQENDWTLNGSVVSLSDYGITPGEEATEISVAYTTYPVDIYLNAAKSKARSAGIQDFQNNAQYDLFILALAAMHYDNRGLTFLDSSTSYNQAGIDRMVNSFVLELRYAKEDPDAPEPEGGEGA